MCLMTAWVSPFMNFLFVFYTKFSIKVKIQYKKEFVPFFIDFLELCIVRMFFSYLMFWDFLFFQCIETFDFYIVDHFIYCFYLWCDA